MKKFHRFLSLLAVVLMLVGMMAACSGGETVSGDGSDTPSGSSGSTTGTRTPGGSTVSGDSSSAPDASQDGDSSGDSSDGDHSTTPTSPNTPVSPTANINRGNYDLGGATIRVIGWSSELEPMLGRSTMDDAYYYAMKYVEEKYNCKFSFQNNFSGDSYNTQILTNALSHKAFADVMTVHVTNYIDWIKRGLLADVTDAIRNAPDASEWKQEISMYKDKLYGIDPTPRRPLHGSYLLYNTALLRALNLESPQTLYNNGEWTFAKLVEYCEKASRRKDTYGIASFGLDSTCFNSAGVRGMYVRDASGKYWNAYTHPSTKGSIEKALNMMLQLKPYMLGDVCQDMPAKLDAVDAFTQNRCLFICTVPEQASAFKSEGEKNYAPVPFPLNGASNWENAESYFAFTAINAYTTLDKAALTAAIMDLKTIWDSGRGKAYYQEDEASWADDLYSKYYQKRSDAEFVINAGKQCTYKGYYWLNLGGTVTWDIVTPVLRGEKTVAQVLSATDSKIQETIDEVLNS